MSEAAEIAAEVAEALAEVGTPVVLTHITLGTGPDASGDTTTTANTYGAPDASFLVGLGYKFGADLVKTGDMKLTVPGGLAFAPAQGDTAAFMGGTWKVIAVQPTYYAGEIVSSDLLVRR